jgi:bifunctional UDP-N-acetylglucosamine pyrophosphorylase/glucosamine-1-phosphate N-acetyltransferase
MQGKMCLSIVLAAGEGVRMHSALPKVLHTLAGRSLLAHVLAAVGDAGGTNTAVVVGPGHEAVAAQAKRVAPGAEIYTQAERRGTAHAALTAKAAIARGADHVVVIFGDTPLLRAQTLQRLRGALADGTAVAVLGFRPADPSGYGRLIMDRDQLTAIREDKDATPAERAIGLCNGGLMALAGQHALDILERIGDDNSQREFYLTDAVTIARELGLNVAAVEVEEDEVRGINTKAQLAAAEAVMQKRLREAALDGGVTMPAPETVFLAADTKLGRDVTVEPYVVFGPGVVVEDGAVIHSFSHLEGAHVGPGVSVGPFARLRPGARLGANSRVGNFVEVKEADIGAGAKANHLSYIGDASVGAEANIGAGTIFCNYDGEAKHHSEVGKGAFIGSNSALVSPVKIGDGAYVATGSVITDDVPADALAFGRARQVVKENRAKALREKAAAGKKKAKPSQ